MTVQEMYQKTKAWMFEKPSSNIYDNYIIEITNKVLAETYAKTTEIEKLKSAFFSSMTHQLADEVAQIQGGADKLYESGGDIDNEEMRQVLKDIERDGVRVTEILNDMLSSNN